MPEEEAVEIVAPAVEINQPVKKEKSSSPKT